MGSLGWLQLTDFHQNQSGQKHLWPDVKEAFYRDLARLHRLSGPWDVIFFTGDLTQKGTPQEFADLEVTLREILGRIAELGSMPLLYPTPGNHDLVRPSREDLVFFERWHEEPGTRDAFWSNPDSVSRQVVSRAFAPFEQWAARQPFAATRRAGALPGDYAAVLEHDGIRLGIVSLSTSFLQLGGGDFTGRLELDVRQLQAVCGGDAPEFLRKQHVNVLLTHHPPHWLHPRAQNELRSSIAPPGRFLLHLYGHMHDPNATSTRIGGAAPRRELQGPALFGLERWEEDGGGQRVHGYCAGRIEVQGTTGTLRIWPRVLVSALAGNPHMERDTRFVLDPDGALTETFEVERPVGTSARQREHRVPRSGELSRHVIEFLAESFGRPTEARRLWMDAGGKAADVVFADGPRELWHAMWKKAEAGAAAKPTAICREALREYPDSEVLRKWLASRATPEMSSVAAQLVQHCEEATPEAVEAGLPGWLASLSSGAEDVLFAALATALDGRLDDRRLERLRAMEQAQLGAQRAPATAVNAFIQAAQISRTRQ